MTDLHQINSIIASAIRGCLAHDPEKGIEPEQAKQIAKCVLEAVADAGLQIVPNDTRKSEKTG